MTEAMKGPKLGLRSISRSLIKGAQHGITGYLLALKRRMIQKLMPVKVGSPRGTSRMGKNGFLAMTISQPDTTTLASLVEPLAAMIAG
jgi:hypothetical protein